MPKINLTRPNNLNETMSPQKGVIVEYDDIVTVYMQGGSTLGFKTIEITNKKNAGSGFGGTPGFSEVYKPDNIVGDTVYKFIPSEIFSKTGGDSIDIRVMSEYNINRTKTSLNVAKADGENPSAVSIDKAFWSLTAPTEPITVTLSEGFVIGKLTLIRYNAFNGEDSKTKEEVVIPEADGLVEYTFKHGEHFTKYGSYLEVKVDAIQPPEDVLEVPYTNTLVGVETLFTELVATASDVIEYNALPNHTIKRAELTTVNTSDERVVHTLVPEIGNTKVVVDMIKYVVEGIESIEVDILAQTPTSTLIISDLENAISSLVDGTQVNAKTTLVFTANEGYTFQKPIRLTFNGKEASVFYPGKENSIVFNEDDTIATISLADLWLPEFDEGEAPVLRVSVFAELKRAEGGLATNFTHIYSVEVGEINQLSTERFFDPFSAGEYLDYSDYIYKLYSLPLKPPSDILSDSKVFIRLGNRNTTTEATAMLETTILYNLGDISVPEEYNNVYDYANTKCLLHVPYQEQPISIDPSYVIGEVINIKLIVDLYNGVASISLTSSKIAGGLVKRVDIPLTHEIPFIRNDKNVLSNTVGRIVNNEVTTSFIEVIRNVPYEINSMFGKSSRDYKVLNTLSGYVEVTDSNIITKASEVERNLIESTLKSGVFINNLVI